MKERRFSITGIEACKPDSAVRGGVEDARKSAMALIAGNANGMIRDGVIVSEHDLTGNHTLLEIGVVVRVVELLPVAATC